MKVFLGGTCNESTWRKELIKELKIDYFNPVVEDWTEECQAEEIRQRKECDYVLYTITPKMAGFYSIAEVVEDSIKSPEKTLFCILTNDALENFNVSALKSLKAVQEMVMRNGGKCFTSLISVAKYLNNQINTKV